MFFQKAVLFVKEKCSWPMLILIAAGLLNFYYVLHYSVNVPYRSEWNYLSVFPVKGSVFYTDRLTRPVLPNLTAYVFYLLNGWNITFHVIFNYLIYLADIVLLYRLIVRGTGEYRFLPLFFLPFFSDINVSNLMLTTALQFHLCVFFGLIAADIGFCRPPTYGNSLKFVLFAALSVSSMNFVFMMGILIGWIIMEALRKNVSRILGVFFCMSAVFQLFCGDLFVFAEKQIFQPAVILFSAALTGIDSPISLHFGFILPIAVALGYAIYKYRLWKDNAAMLLLSIILAAFLSALNSEKNQSDYMFIHDGVAMVLFAVPIVFSLMRLVKPVFIYLCCLGVIGYSASFSPSYFKMESDMRKQTLDCAENYYNAAGDGNCQFIDEHRSADFLDLSKKLDLNFTRKK